jgi:cytochrome c oxidase cbb3-type subunit 3
MGLPTAPLGWQTAGVRIAVLIVLAACGQAGTDSARGEEVFAQMCAACHGPAGKPDAAMVARLGVKDLTAPEFRSKVTVKLVSDQIHNGSQNKLMPSFDGALKEFQIQAVAEYVASPKFP